MSVDTGISRDLIKVNKNKKNICQFLFLSVSTSTVFNFLREKMEATTTEKFYSKSSKTIFNESMAISEEKSTVNKQICPFCYCQELNLDDHFKNCENYMKALSKERCPLCNDKLKESPNKKYHWKYKCKVVNIMKESGKCFLEIASEFL